MGISRLEFFKEDSLFARQPCLYSLHFLRFSAVCCQFFRQDNKRLQLFLRKVLRVQSPDEVGFALFGAKTEWGVPWVRGDLDRVTNLDVLGGPLYHLQALFTVFSFLALIQNPAPRILQTMKAFLAIPPQSYVTLTNKQNREDFFHA